MPYSGDTLSMFAYDAQSLLPTYIIKLVTFENSMGTYEVPTHLVCYACPPVWLHMYVFSICIDSKCCELCIYTCICVCMYKFMYMYVECVWVSVYTCVCTCVCTCVHMQIAVYVNYNT